ncbi:MAG: hypothetical protein R3F14_35425 [Polyangiaceae bacterium]
MSAALCSFAPKDSPLMPEYTVCTGPSRDAPSKSREKAAVSPSPRHTCSP